MNGHEVRRKAWGSSAVCRDQAPVRPEPGAQTQPLLGQRGREKVPASSEEFPGLDPGQEQ